MKNIKTTEMLNGFTVENLLTQWELLSKMEMSQEVADVRGWILGALETKNPEAMNEYYDGFYEDDELRSFFK